MLALPIKVQSLAKTATFAYQISTPFLAVGKGTHELVRPFVWLGKIFRLTIQINRVSQIFPEASSIRPSTVYISFSLCEEGREKEKRKKSKAARAGRLQRFVTHQLTPPPGIWAELNRVHDIDLISWKAITLIRDLFTGLNDRGLNRVFPTP